MKLDKQFDSYTFFGSLHWDHVWERQQELTSRFAKLISNRIYRCNPLGMINYNPLSHAFIHRFTQYCKQTAFVGECQNPRPDNMCEAGGFIIPWHNRLCGKINYLLLRKRMHLSRNNFFWATYPNYTIYEFFKRSQFKVYDIAERRSQNPIIPEYIKRLERKMVEQADIVFADNHATMEDYKELNPDIIYVPQGVNTELFANKDSSETEREYIGYIGNFHSAMNYPFLRKLIEINSSSKFLLVGEILEPEAHGIMAMPNVTHIDKVQKNELPKYLMKMKYGLIPYLVNEVTIGVYPTKLFEYIAAGVPVISTPLPEVVQYADDDYMKIIDEPIELDFNFAMNKCGNLLKDNTWDARWDKYIKEINRC